MDINHGTRYVGAWLAFGPGDWGSNLTWAKLFFPYVDDIFQIVTNNRDEKNNSCYQKQGWKIIIYLIIRKVKVSVGKRFLKDSFKQCARIGAAIMRMRTSAQVLALLGAAIMRMRASAQVLALLGGVFGQCACA